MAAERVLVTGATGMIGSAVAQRACDAGYRVRALVRASSDRSLLDPLDVEYAEGDLRDGSSLEPIMDEVDIVVHAGAHIGDWGPADLYRAVNVVGLEHLLTAAQRRTSLRRWIQISSLGVYPARDHHGTDESTPPDLDGLDGYTRTKAEAELVLRRHMEEYPLPAVILRPGFVYGRGERHVLPRMIERLESGTMKLIGDGTKPLNNTHVGNLAEAVMLAIENDRAVGETYNIRDERLVDRVEYVQAVCDYINRPFPRRVPFWVARALVGPIENWARWTGRSEAPILTAARLKFLARSLDFSIDKAKRELGYEGRLDFQQGIVEALDSVTGREPAACEVR